MTGERHRRRRWLQRASRRAPRDDTGMSLLEVIIALAILMVVLVPVATLISNVIGQAASSRERLTALSLAEQYIELLNNTPMGSKPSPTATPRNQTPSNASLPKTDTLIEQTTSPLDRSTVAYTVYARFTWTTADGTTPDMCTAGTVPTLLNLQVKVEWSSGSQQVTDVTKLNYPPAGILHDGFLAIKVDGDPATSPPSDALGHSWATRVQHVPVTITPHTVAGYSTVTRYPNKYGCVFEQVPPGQYTVAVANPSPDSTFGTRHWVASYDEGLTYHTPSLSTVVVSQVTTVTFGYDEGAVAHIGYPTTTVAENGVTCPDAGSILCVAAGQSPSSAGTPTRNPRADLSVLTSSGWTTYTPPATRLAADTCAGTRRCLAVGYSAGTTGTFSGASVSTSTAAVSFSADAVPVGVTVLDGVVCPSTGSCYAYGEGAGGSTAVILSGSVGTTGIAWTSDTGLTGVSTVSALACTSATACYAVGTTSAGPTILSLAGTGAAWTADALPSTPSTVASISRVTCRSTACFALGSSSSGALILSPSPKSTTTWIEDTTPATTTLSQLTCPSATICYAAGTASSKATVLTLWSTTATTVTWHTVALPSSVTSIGQLTCPGTTTCFAIGSAGSSPVILSALSAVKWTPDALPPSLQSLSDLTCSGTSNCLATATATVGGALQAALLYLHTASTWKEVPVPAGVHPAYFAGLACTAGGHTCAAPGASATGTVLLSGGVSGATWKNGTPSGSTGLTLRGIPVSVTNLGLTPDTVQEMAAPTVTAGNVTSVGPLFPFTSGYHVAAAACSTQVTSTAPAVSSVPGGTAAVTLAMGLLPVEVENPSTGAPAAGAIVTATPTCTTPLTPPPGSTNRTAFTLEPTGPLGLSETAVMYGTYTVTATLGAQSGTAVVTVSRTGITVGGTTQPLPAAVVVTL